MTKQELIEEINKLSDGTEVRLVIPLCDNPDPENDDEWAIAYEMKIEQIDRHHIDIIGELA